MSAQKSVGSRLQGRDDAAMGCAQCKLWLEQKVAGSITKRTSPRQKLRPGRRRVAAASPPRHRRRVMRVAAAATRRRRRYAGEKCAPRFQGRRRGAPRRGVDLRSLGRAARDLLKTGGRARRRRAIRGDGLQRFGRRPRLQKHAGGDQSRGYSVGTSRGAAAAATWTFRGGESRRRNGRDVNR